MQQARVYSFDTHSAAIRPILSELKFDDPVASTYRAEDDAYYVLDRTRRSDGSGNGRGDPIMRLVRMPRGLSIELVAEWPRPERMSTFGITTGTEGSLVISGSSNERHAICALRSLDAYHVTPTVILRGEKPLGVFARQSREAITYAVVESDGMELPVRVTLPVAAKNHHDPGGDDVEEGDALPFDEVSTCF
jgi:hypothetical protein